jgi:hypothetical protein
VTSRLAAAATSRLERGWTDERYAIWLGRMWVSMLVADDQGTVGGPS